MGECKPPYNRGRGEVCIYERDANGRTDLVCCPISCYPPKCYDKVELEFSCSSGAGTTTIGPVTTTTTTTTIDPNSTTTSDPSTTTSEPCDPSCMVYTARYQTSIGALSLRTSSGDGSWNANISDSDQQKIIEEVKRMTTIDILTERYFTIINNLPIDTGGYGGLYPLDGVDQAMSLNIGRELTGPYVGSTYANSTLPRFQPWVGMQAGSVTVNGSIYNPSLAGFVFTATLQGSIPFSYHSICCLGQYTYTFKIPANTLFAGVGGLPAYPANTFREYGAFAGALSGFPWPVVTADGETTLTITFDTKSPFVTTTSTTTTTPEPTTTPDPTTTTTTTTTTPCPCLGFQSFEGPIKYYRTCIIHDEDGCPSDGTVKVEAVCGGGQTGKVIEISPGYPFPGATVTIPSSHCCQNDKQKEKLSATWSPVGGGGGPGGCDPDGILNYYELTDEITDNNNCATTTTTPPPVCKFTLNLDTTGCCIELVGNSVYAVGDGTLYASIKEEGGGGYECCSKPSVKICESETGPCSGGGGPCEEGEGGASFYVIDGCKYDISIIGTHTSSYGEDPKDCSCTNPDDYTKDYGNANGIEEHPDPCTTTTMGPGFRIMKNIDNNQVKILVNKNFFRR